MISGVCGGLGQYLGVDPTFVRIFFVLLAFYNLLGVWVYIIMAILLPTAPAGMEESVEYINFRESPQTTKVIGGGLILVGFLALISSLDLRIFSWLRFEIFWPFLLVLFGIVLLVRVVNQED
jgi:phage shock protein PspC (stress-responsive transcriptional regulator)